MSLGEGGEAGRSTDTRGAHSRHARRSFYDTSLQQQNEVSGSNRSLLYVTFDHNRYQIKGEKKIGHNGLGSLLSI